jgi:hypothetical protein
MQQIAHILTNQYLNVEGDSSNGWK